tara:strand:+ start:3686 stop:4213 length:528 start_codon:yes stop_codon:yes gene_type:complete
MRVRNIFIILFTLFALIQINISQAQQNKFSFQNKTNILEEENQGDSYSRKTNRKKRSDWFHPVELNQVSFETGVKEVTEKVSREAVTFMGYSNQGTSIVFLTASYFESLNSVQLTCLKYQNGFPQKIDKVTLILEDAGDGNRLIGKYVFPLVGNRVFKLPAAARDIKLLTISLEP